MTTHHEVYSVVEGALDETRIVRTGGAEERAEALAGELRIAAELQGFKNWAVFIIPHYCGDVTNPDSPEPCECVQYLTDHHPIYSNEGDVQS